MSGIRSYSSIQLLRTHRWYCHFGLSVHQLQASCFSFCFHSWYIWCRSWTSAAGLDLSAGHTSRWRGLEHVHYDWQRKHLCVSPCLVSSGGRGESCPACYYNFIWRNLRANVLKDTSSETLHASYTEKMLDYRAACSSHMITQSDSRLRMKWREE
jgi:hypothetical protein